MERSDEEIVSQVRDGDKEAFSGLILRYQKQIFNLMYRYSRSEQEAADLTQEVFLRAYEKIHRFRPGGSFFSWLYTMALNRARDWSRKQKRWWSHQQEMRDAGAAAISGVSGQERLLLRQEDLAQLQEALGRLPDETRELLMLRYHHNRSVKEAAEIFSISESAVKMRILRGLKQLQDLMEEKRSWTVTGLQNSTSRK